MNKEERVRENLVCNLGGEDEQATQMRRNAESKALQEPLEEFFEQFKEAENRDVKTNKEMMKHRMGDQITPKFKNEEKTTTKKDWDARFYNDNKKYDVVDDREPELCSSHSTNSTSLDSTNVL